MKDPADAVRALAEPVADRLAVSLLDVAVKGSGGRMHVKLVVDRKGGVDVDTCQQPSRELGRSLDEADPIPGRFVLEVTSPGMDWPLRDRAAFDRVEGRTVHVTQADGAEVEGSVVAAGPDAVTLRTSDGEVEVAYAQIDVARQALPW